MELTRAIRAFTREEEGLAAIEYALIASLVAVAIVAGAADVGANLNIMFTTLSGRFSG